MMRKSDPMDLFMQWYNYRRTHMSLNDGETPAEAFERKMAPKGKRIIDEQTGEEYDVSQRGGNDFSYTTSRADVTKP